MLRLVLLDIDGVLTDGKVTIDSLGNEYKTINFKDLDAITEMKKMGLQVGFLTGEASPITSIFEKKFRPDFFYRSCKDKVKALQEIMAQTGLSPDDICYVGDGKYDIPVMKSVSYSVCPADAITEIKNLSTIRLNAKGGEGCAWELLEWILAKKI